MTTNEGFLEALRKSFARYLEHGERSNEKLLPLHSCIARDLAELCGPGYTIKSLGYREGIEQDVQGRYYPKKVDITISKNGRPIAGVAVKFVMSNYSQNNINYFECMLGETANIRTANVPYFQVFIIFDKVPYYENGGRIKKYEEINYHNLEKYVVMSRDNPDMFYHTPDKTLICVIELKEPKYDVENKEGYFMFYKSIINDPKLMSYSTRISDRFENSVILNNYEDFIKRIYAIIQGKLKS